MEIRDAVYLIGKILQGRQKDRASNVKINYFYARAEYSLRPGSRTMYIGFRIKETEEGGKSQNLEERPQSRGVGGTALRGGTIAEFSFDQNSRKKRRNRGHPVQLGSPKKICKTKQKKNKLRARSSGQLRTVQEKVRVRERIDAGSIGATHKERKRGIKSGRSSGVDGTIREEYQESILKQEERKRLSTLPHLRRDRRVEFAEISVGK